MDPLNGNMRYNGKFQYKLPTEAVRNPETGLYTSDGENDWQPGCECQIDNVVPAKHFIGTDGQEYTYNYNVFIPTWFDGRKLAIGTQIKIIGENGFEDEFEIKSIDTLNRKYIEVWG